MANPTEDYFAKLKLMQSQNQSNASYDDISKRASELSMLMPKTRNRGLYGLASDLSKGLVQQAASGRPSSIGYGLAAGFNLYSEAADQRQVKAEEMRSKLMQMAYTDVENRRAASQAMQEKMLDANFKFELQMLKEQGGVFEGKSLEAQMFNILLAAESDPTIKLKPEYKLALRFVQEPRRTPVQTETGTQIITSPGLNVEDIFGSGEEEVAPVGATFTGRYHTDGKEIFQRPGVNGAIEYFTKD